MASDIPFISQRSVQHVLDSMVHGGQSEQPSPLENLILIEDILLDPTLPNMEYAATFALHDLLIDLIRHEFATQCQIFGLEEPKANLTRTLAFQEIEHYAYPQVAELTGWMLLYFRYVCPNLNITSSDLQEIIAVDARTLRRYQTNAVKKLTKVISIREWTVRQEKHKLYLYSQLPISISDRIWGRDALLTHVNSIIASNARVHLLITGPDGIGKTSFVQTVVKGLIDDAKIDQLAWFTDPQSADFVQTHLKQVLLKDSRISLKEYSLLNRLIVVLDDIDHLINVVQAEELFEKLNNSLVIVTNRIYRQIESSFTHITLPELEKDAVTSIVSEVRPTFQRDTGNLNVFATNLWNRVGGNPLAVKLAANNLTNLDLQQPMFAEGQGNMIYSLLLSSYSVISHNAQILLLMFALMPAIPVTQLMLLSLWIESRVADSDIIALLSCGLIASHPDGESYILPDTSRRFIHWLYDDSTVIQGHIVSLVKNLVDLSPDSLPHHVVEHILLQEWMDIPIQYKKSLAEAGVSHGILHGNYMVWSSILGAIILITQNVNLKLYYAICLRQLSEFSQAETLFREIIDYCGRMGDFQQQGRGMFELSILFRQQGLYEQAITLVEHARSILVTQKDQDIVQKIDIEIAQSLLDAGAIDPLKARIADLSTYGISDVKAMILLSEILLRLKDYGGAKLYAERASKSASGANLGRVYAILGRICTEQKDFESAQDWFDMAISLLEQESDWYGLARAKSNLAAVFLQQQQYIDDAELLLFQAQMTQRTLNDRAGMIYTTHNIEILNAVKWIDET